MEGIAILSDEETSLYPEQKTTSKEQEFAKNVRQILHSYFATLDGEEPNELYSLVLAELEQPLLKMVMKFTNSNQSKAAKILGISRGTLRKKLAQYSLN